MASEVEKCGIGSCIYLADGTRDPRFTARSPAQMVQERTRDTQWISDSDLHKDVALWPPSTLSERTANVQAAAAASKAQSDAIVAFYQGNPEAFRADLATALCEEGLQVELRPGRDWIGIDNGLTLAWIYLSPNHLGERRLGMVSHEFSTTAQHPRGIAAFVSRKLAEVARAWEIQRQAEALHPEAYPQTLVPARGRFPFNAIKTEEIVCANVAPSADPDGPPIGLAPKPEPTPRELAPMPAAALAFTFKPWGGQR